MERTTLSESLRGVEADIAAGRPEQALARAQELLTWYPRALPIQRVLGEIYLALRKPREALAALDRVLAGDPEDARACCARAIVHQMHGDTMAALAWYRRACDIRPEDAALRATYSELARSLNQPLYRPSRMGLARLYLRGDLYTHAIRELEMLVAEGGDRFEAQVVLAEALWRARQYDEAEATCRRVLTNAPTCVKALLLSAWTAAHGNRLEEAQPLMQRVRELDPDHRIAQALFADELEAQEPLVTQLIWAGTPGGHGPTGPLGQSGVIPGAARPSVSRPLVNGQNGGAQATQGAQGAQATGQATGPLTGASAMSSSEFQQVFRETAFMIWGPEEETRERAAIPRQGAAAQPGSQQAGQPASHQSDEARQMPPLPQTLLQGEADPNDPEAQQALNWVQWLKSQGALPHGTTGGPATNTPPQQQGRSTATFAPTPPASGQWPAPSYPIPVAPVAPVAPAAPPLPQRPAMPPTAQGQPSAPGQSGASGPLPLPPTIAQPQMPPGVGPTTGPLNSAGMAAVPASGPLPTPSAEALRSMFAELGPQTGMRSAVRPNSPTDTPDAGKRYQTARLAPQSGAESGNSGNSGNSGSGNTDGSTSGVFADAIASATGRMPVDGPLWPPSAPATSATDGASSVVTLESLEQQFADSGFHRFEARPGALADIAAGKAPEAAAAEAAPEPEPEPEPPAGPAPDDYPARLALARQHREDGKLNEAVLEYRAVLKNSAELFSDVLSDLHELVTEAPQLPEVHRLLGDGYIHQGDYLSALESYNRALALSQAQE